MLRCDWLENDVCETLKKRQSHAGIDRLTAPLILLPNLVHVKINGRAVLLMNEQSEVNDRGGALDHSRGARRSLKKSSCSIPRCLSFGEDMFLRPVLGDVACKL